MDYDRSTRRESPNRVRSPVMYVTSLSRARTYAFPMSTSRALLIVALVEPILAIVVLVIGLRVLKLSSPTKERGEPAMPTAKRRLYVVQSATRRDRDAAVQRLNGSHGILARIRGSQTWVLCVVPSHSGGSLDNRFPSRVRQRRRTIPLTSPTYSLSASHPSPPQLRRALPATFTATTNATGVSWVMVGTSGTGTIPATDAGTLAQASSDTVVYTAPAIPPVYGTDLETAGTATVRALAGGTSVDTTFPITAPSITTGFYTPSSTLWLR